MPITLFLDIFTKAFFILSPFFGVDISVSAVPIGRWLGHKGLQMMMKITGLILTAIAAEIVFTGIGAFFDRLIISTDIKSRCDNVHRSKSPLKHLFS
jgi:hypothetical protein